MDRLTHLIDDLARDMTSGPPDVELARRVAARIADAQGRRSHRWSRGWLLAPAAGACVVALAVFVTRDRREPLRPAPPAATTTNADATATAPAVSTPVAPVSVPLATPAPSRPARPATAPPPRSAIEPLTLASIDVERLAVSPLARSERIDISPIAIDRIEIAAMP